MAKKKTAKISRLPCHLMRKPSPIQFPKKVKDYEPRIGEPRIYGKTRELIKKQGYFFRNTNDKILEETKRGGRYFSYQEEDTHLQTVYVNPIFENVIAEGVKIGKDGGGRKPILLAINARPYIGYATSSAYINQRESPEIRISIKVDFIKDVTVIDSLSKLEEILSLAGLPFNPEDKAIKDFEKYYLSQPSPAK